MQNTQRTGIQQAQAGTFMVGLLCGAALGAAAGLMFAPKRGVELRQQMAASADKARRQAANVYGGATQAVHDAVARGRHAIEAGRHAFQGQRPSNGAAKDMAMP